VAQKSALQCLGGRTAVIVRIRLFCLSHCAFAFHRIPSHRKVQLKYNYANNCFGEGECLFSEITCAVIGLSLISQQ
jgi:hypothetical protein